MTDRKIIHVDMDCFYAAVEVKHRPELRGKPLGIGGPANSRSVLCTASYEARKFNVRAAMPSSQAVRLCPNLILIPPNFELYKKESRAVREIFKRYTEKVEPLSLDEAYLDVTGSKYFDGSATLIANNIRSQIFKELNLTASAGVASNKFLAKIASDWNKPNGQFVIRPREVEKFMINLKVEKIFGVGKVTAKKMHSLGLFTCGDIQKTDIFQLSKCFGSRAKDLRDLSFGIDSRSVEPNSERKSFTVEETFNKDIATFKECKSELRSLYQSWDARMKKYGLADNIRGYVVKVKYHDFKTTTHETSKISWPSYEDFEVLFENIWEKREEPIRLIGLGVRLGSIDKKESDQMVFGLA